jgi:DNA invertase Pin-like site-specific DNA recombinase
MEKATVQDTKILAYLRVSTDKQDLLKQHHEVLEYARRKRIFVDDFIEVQASSRKVAKSRRIEELMERLDAGDTLIVSELTRLGRSLGEIVALVDELVRRKIRFISIKDGIRIEGNGEKDLQTTIQVAMFALFAEVERKLISERTKAGLAAVRAKGKRLGRPKGSLGNSRLDGKEGLILEDLKYGVSKAAIARKHGVSRTTLYSFIRTRDIG